MSAPAKVLAATAAAFRSLDLEAENARIAEIESDVATIEAAIGRAEARRAEIGALLQPRGLSAGPPVNMDHGHAIADALLTLEPSAAAAVPPKEEELRAELSRIGQGVRELRQRVEARGGEIKAVQQQARAKVLDAAQPLVDAIADEAREAGRVIVDAFVALRAIETATRSGFAQTVQTQAVADALIVRGGHGGLLNGQIAGDLPAPDDIARLLDNLEGKGAALPVARPATFRAF